MAFDKEKGATELPSFTEKPSSKKQSHFLDHPDAPITIGVALFVTVLVSIICSIMFQSMAESGARVRIPVILAPFLLLGPIGFGVVVGSIGGAIAGLVYFHRND